MYRNLITLNGIYYPTRNLKILSKVENWDTLGMPVVL